MPMDEGTKATVRALLDRHPRGYVAEELGFAVTGTAAGLFRLLVLAILADDSAPSARAAEATRALLDRRWDSAPEMDRSGERERAEVLEGAGYRTDAKDVSRTLGEATRLVMERYGGDLGRLREAAAGDGARLRELLSEIPGVDEAGLAVFLREAQMFWPEAGPYADEHALAAARELGLPADPGALLEDVARGGGHEELSWLVGALAIADARDEYAAVREASGA